MASRTVKEEWIEHQRVQLANGPGISWRHRITGATVVMPEGVHPMDNPNALAIVQGMPEDSEDDAPEDVPETPEDRVRVLLSRAGSEGRAVVKLYKIKPDKTKAFCNEYTVDEFDAGGHSMIRTHWGPGNYQILLYGNHPVSGKFARLGLEQIEIMPTMTNDVAQNNPLANFDAIMAKIDEKIAAIAPQKDPRSEFAEMMKMMIMMREAFAPPPAPSMAEQIAQMSGMLNVTQQLREMASEKETPSDPLMAMGMKAMDVIPMLMQGARSAPSTPQTNPQALPAPAPNVRLATPANQPQPQPQPQTQPSQQDQTMPDENQQMLQSIRRVNALAVMGVDPEKAADMIYDLAPPDLAQFLQMPDWFAQLSAMVPEVAEHEAWYTALASEYLKIDAEVQADAENEQTADKLA